jgi:hypothetical protein
VLQNDPDDLGLICENQPGRLRTTPDAHWGVNAIERSHGLAAQGLISELNALRKAAGNPSLGQLVRLSQHKLAKATLDDHLAGRRTRLPPWRLVSAYVSACHEAAASTGIDIRRLGTLEEWYVVWKAALEGDIGVTSPLNKFTIADDPTALDKQKAVLSVGRRTTALKKIGPSKETSKSIRAEQATEGVDPNSVTASIGPILRQIEERSSKRAQSLPSHMALLIVINGATIGKNFQIKHNLTTIGRNPESDIWLNDPTVSRRHAIIRRRGDRFFVDDVGSSNGTFLHRELVEYESVISAYDELRIGTFVLGAAPLR